MTPEQYRSALRDLSTAVAAQVDRLYQAFKAGTLTESEFIDTATALIAAAREQAAALADVGLAVTLSQQTGRDVAPAGVTPVEPTWLPGAFAKVLAEPGDIAYRLGTIAANEALTAEKIARAQAMKAHGARWTRIAHAGACPACLNMTGTVLPASVTIWHHPGCTCVAQPVE